MRKLLQDILERLEGGENLVLASIVAKSGSAPRGTGTKMAVRSDGTILGTIGGGRVEAAVMEDARALFEEKGAHIRQYSLTKEELAGIGMTCGGKMTVCSEYIDAENTDIRAALQQVLQLQESGIPSWLITEISPDGSSRRGVYAPGAGRDAAFPKAVLKECTAKSRLAEYEGAQYFIERVGGLEKAFVFGGGHIGKALVPLLDSLGFDTTILDDRAEFCDAATFPTAEERVLGFGEEVFKHLAFDARSYLVIITRGHLADQEVLEWALKYAGDAAYIGMIGSRAKRFAMYDALLEKGYRYEELQGVHSPIGLPIGAETPEELAVCIAAEMIEVRAKNKR